MDQTESFTACVLSQNRETSSEASVEIPRAHDLGLHEAINYAGLPLSYGLPSGLPLSSGNGSILKSNFEYDIATDTGHKANCEFPRLFELHNCKEKFQKILALSVILERINIAKSNANNKHVILHFKQNDEILKRTFDLLEEKCNKQQIYLDVQNKTTEKYKDFQDDNLGKYIFLGYFRIFRGLEHPSVRLVIDPDIGALRHYLIECIARCTTQLNIVLLGSNEELTELTAQWKYRTENEQLVEKWRVEIVNDGIEQKKELFERKEKGFIKIFKISECYKNMEKFFSSQRVWLSSPDKLKESAKKQLQR